MPTLRRFKTQNPSSFVVSPSIPISPSTTITASASTSRASLCATSISKAFKTALIAIATQTQQYLPIQVPLPVSYANNVLVHVPESTSTILMDRNSNSTVITPKVLKRKRPTIDTASIIAHMRVGKNLFVSRQSVITNENQHSAIQVSSHKEQRKYREILLDAWDILYEQYVDESSLNWTRLKHRFDARISNVTSIDQLHSTLRWLCFSIGDPFTRFLTAFQLHAMQGDMDGEMCGVGIIFSAERHGPFGIWKRVVIHDVVPGSPAFHAGLQRTDEITAIDMASVKHMSFEEATHRLLGKVGRKVLLTFKRRRSANSTFTNSRDSNKSSRNSSSSNSSNSSEEEEELSVLLSRKKFQVPTVRAERIRLSNENGNAEEEEEVCFVHIREFAANTPKQLIHEIRRVLKEKRKEEMEKKKEEEQQKRNENIPLITHSSDSITKTSTRTDTSKQSNGICSGAPFKAIILDLRGNSGGLVDKAVEVASYFSDTNDTIVKFIGRDNEIEIQQSLHPYSSKLRRELSSSSSSLSSSTTVRNGNNNFLFFSFLLPFWSSSSPSCLSAKLPPVLVLVDGETASASELVAAAVRDNCHGIVIGRPTFGKGSIQAIVPLAHDAGGIAVTVARYRTPRGEGFIHGAGIRPDWTMDCMPEDGRQVVKKVFGKRPKRNLTRISKKLERCNAKKCSDEKKRAEMKTGV